MFINMNKSGKTKVDIKTYNDLMLDSCLLRLLKCGGVDNWEWYDEARYPEDGDTWDDFEEWYTEANNYGEND